MVGRTRVVAILASVVVAGGAVFGVSQLAGGNPTEPEGSRSPTQTAEPLEPSAGSTAPSAPASPTSKPRPAAVLEPGDSGLKVRQLQARLKQIEWYEPKINGKYDDTTAEAVRGFQAKRDLTRTGIVDQKTWTTLTGMTDEPTDDELNNRMTAGPTIIGSGSAEDDVRELQARLKQIGWYADDVTGTYGDATTTAVSGFQTKREIPSTGEVDQRTWDLLVGMTSTPSDDELHNRMPDADGIVDSRCLTGDVLCIDKSNNILRWVRGGGIELTLDVRFGCVGTPTREGQFSVYTKSRDHVSSLYDSEMPFAMFFDGGQAVHYSSDFANAGYSGCSHGCVNVRDYDSIAWLYDQVAIGDKVVVY